MPRTRIPERIDPFNNYINDTADYLLAITGSPPQLTWLRLGLINANATDWDAKRIYWRDTLYPDYSNPATCTSITRDKVRNFMKQFRVFANPLLNVMAASSAVIESDEAEFNLVKRRKGAAHRRTSINEMCDAAIEIHGGASFVISCRMPEAQGRARLAPGADSVLIAYAFVQTSADVRSILPDDSTMSAKISSRARFHFSAGVPNIGKWLVIYTRWYNMRHPDFAGPWSSMHRVMIS